MRLVLVTVPGEGSALYDADTWQCLVRSESPIECVDGGSIAEVDVDGEAIPLTTNGKYWDWDDLTAYCRENVHPSREPLPTPPPTT